MKTKIEEVLVKAALKNEAGREDFIKTLHQVPLNKENFDHALQCAMGLIAQRWVMDVYTPQLLCILSTPQGWDDWVDDFPFLDELILSASQDPQWLEALSFRWTSSDGRPEGGPRTTARTTAEQDEFFSACWKATIASNNVPRLQQLLNHPVWKTRLKEEYVDLAIWRPFEVWRVFHDNHHALPLRLFWQGAMATHQWDAHTDNRKKLHFLITEAGSTAEFIVQQYTHSWRYPLPQDLNEVFAGIASQVVPDTSVIEKFHHRIVNFLLKLNDTHKNLCAKEITALLTNTPLFDGQRFILALINSKEMNLTDQQSAVVEAVFNTVDPAIQNTLLPQCSNHHTFGHLPFVQKYRIEQNLESIDSSVRVKKI